MKPPQKAGPHDPAQCDGEDASAASKERPEAPAKLYHPPRLVCYGRVAEITQFGGSQVVDSGSGSLGEEL